MQSFRCVLLANPYKNFFPFDDKEDAERYVEENYFSNTSIKFSDSTYMSEEPVTYRFTYLH